MFYKRIQREYFTSERQHKVWPSISQFCWRNCGFIGDIFHVFWSCPLLRTLWAEVFCLINKITGVSISVNPTMALLHIYPEQMPGGDRYLIGHILIATKASVAKLWKSSRVPNLTDILNKVNKHFLFETVSYNLSAITYSILMNWSKWEVSREELSRLFMQSSNILPSPQSNTECSYVYYVY